MAEEKKDKMRKNHCSLGKSQEQVQVFISSSQGVCLSHMPFTVLFKQFVLRLISSSHSPLASTCYRPGNFQPRKQKVPFFFFFYTGRESPICYLKLLHKAQEGSEQQWCCKKDGFMAGVVRKQMIQLCH